LVELRFKLIYADIQSMQRLFFKDTGIHIAEWRQTARLLAASTELLDGASVTQAALASGYASTSAFISAFCRRTGRTPREYRSHFQK
jgi:methylphosphotriester-DNA--protein-cysteine methyltransferase